MFHVDANSVQSGLPYCAGEVGSQAERVDSWKVVRRDACDITLLADLSEHLSRTNSSRNLKEICQLMAMI